MLIRLVRSGGTKSETYECMHYTVETVTPGSYAATHGLKPVGVTIEVGRKSPKAPDGPTLVLKEGDIAYVMDNAGDTIDSIKIDPQQLLNFEEKLEAVLKEVDSDETVQTSEG